MLRGESRSCVWPLHQPQINTVTLDLSNTSNSAGTEISSALGFDLLSMLEIMIDYHDGLMDFVYYDNHGVADYTLRPYVTDIALRELVARQG